MEKYKAIILEILNIVSFSEDKEVFANKFVETVNLQSLNELVKTLPEDKKSSLKEQIEKNLNDAQKISELLKSYFSEEQAVKAIQNSSRDMLIEYIESIKNTLSEEQRKKLIQAFEKIVPENQIAS